MARLDKFTTDQVELFRGTIDFYLYKGVLPVARSWPRKPKPPYTALQAEAMAVFALASSYTSTIGGIVLDWWRLTAEGSRQQWTDTFKGLIMSYWKETKTIALIVIDMYLEKNNDDIQIFWKVLQTDLDYNEEISDIQTQIIDYNDLLLQEKPIWFTLSDDDGRRLISPYFRLEVFI